MSTDQSKQVVLYVDDEPQNLRAFKSMFRRTYRVITASTGREALELFKTEEPDVLVTDQRMPEMTGVELMQEVKQINAQTPLILLTAYTDHEVLKQAVNEVGLFRYLNKPFTQEVMQTVLDLATETKDLKQQKSALTDSLNASEERFRQLVEYSPFGLIMFDSRQIPIIINQAAEDMLGYSRQELYTTPLSKLTSSESLIVKDEVFRARIRRGKNYVVREEVMVRVKGGELRPFFITTYAVEEHDNLIRISAFVDISQEKKHRGVIQKQVAILKQIAWEHAHQVRAPLSNLLGLVELLKLGSSEIHDEQFIEGIDTQTGILDASIKELVVRIGELLEQSQAEEQ